ncbi:MAG: PorV/PorQ family protein [candidate division Zixibacteria bacterium]|nr:PorV/PorQ family protein [candidate division Zixibacteria bacterium]
MKKSCLALLLSGGLLLAFAGEAYCGVSDAAVLFLRIAPGARSAAMGEAFVAVADDASATHWNPAGLGEYPLADSWYRFKLSDDSHLKDIAKQALYGKLGPDYLETLRSWQIKGNQVSRFVDEEWKQAETISVDPARDLVTNLSHLARTSDEKLFKQATRTICAFNSGVSFAEINDIRLQLLRLVAEEEVGDSVNAMMEEMLVFWMDLRLDANEFNQFKTRVEMAGTDGGISPEELVRIEELAAACEIATRPLTVEVPYTVLLTVWRRWEVPWEEYIEKIAVMENDVPNSNYTRYDIWAITNFGLKRFDGVAWRDGMSTEGVQGVIPKPGDKIDDVIKRALSSTDESVVASRLEQIARANNRISRSALLELKDQVAADLPTDFLNRDEFLEMLEQLEQAWWDCLLDGGKLDEFVSDYRSARSDSLFTETEIDRLLFTLKHVIKGELPEVIHFPLNAVFDGAINDLAVYKKTLYIATDVGLYRFNGRAWQKFSTGVENEAIYCVESVKREQLWIGTDSGIKHYAQSNWTTYGPAEGVATVPIKHIHVESENKVWAAADDDLFYFDGTKWNNTWTYTTTVTDSARSVFSNFYGDLDETRIDMELVRLQFSHPDLFENPQPGVEVQVPFKPLFEGKITALTVDGEDNLWVGTELGIKWFDDGRWHSFGYAAVKLEEPMTIEELAARYYKTSDPEAIAGYVSILKRKNTIQQGELAKGRVIYVWKHLGGSPIHTLRYHDGTVYIGSLLGTFCYMGNRWERFYHEGLHRANTKSIVSTAGEMWFATSDQVIISAHARKEISFTHSQWLPELASDLYYEFLSWVQPIGGLGTVGTTVTFLSLGENTRIDEYNNVLGTFNSFDAAFTLSYGIRVSNNVSLGLSAKVIYSHLAEIGSGRELGKGTATSFGIDAGVIYRPMQRLRLGAALTNVGPDVTYIDAAQSDPLPRKLALGLGYKLLDSPYNSLLLVGEIKKPLTGTDDFDTELREIIPSVGAEYWYGSLLALRAGYLHDSEGERKFFSLGLGLQLKDKYRLDFAYIPTSETHVLGNTLRTSLTVKL